MHSLTCMSVVVCVVRKPRPCNSYRRRRDCINSVLWRSYYKGGGGYHMVPQPFVEHPSPPSSGALVAGCTARYPARLWHTPARPIALDTGFATRRPTLGPPGSSPTLCPTAAPLTVHRGGGKCGLHFPAFSAFFFAFSGQVA